MKFKFFLVSVFIALFLSGCNLGKTINNYQWNNASNEAKQKREAYYEMQCKADPVASIQTELKDGYGVLYVYTYGCSFCDYQMLPENDGFILNVTGYHVDYDEREIFINNELLGKYNIWNFTILYLKAGKYNLSYKGKNGSFDTDVNIIAGVPTIFYPQGEKRAVVGQNRENVARIYANILKWSRPFHFKMPKNEKYAKNTKDFLDLSVCNLNFKR